MTVSPTATVGPKLWGAPHVPAAAAHMKAYGGGTFNRGPSRPSANSRAVRTTGAGAYDRVPDYSYSPTAARDGYSPAAAATTAGKRAARTAAKADRAEFERHEQIRREAAAPRREVFPMRRTPAVVTPSTTPAAHLKRCAPASLAPRKRAARAACCAKTPRSRDRRSQPCSAHSLGAAPWERTAPAAHLEPRGC